MPELAELRLTSDYINKAVYVEGYRPLSFVNIRKNPEHKGQEIIPPSGYFSIKAKSRGKELMLTLSNNIEEKNIRMTMGMSGHFKLTNTMQEPKHSHLKFFSNDGVTLSFVDTRRFGKWKETDAWSENRSPDPTTEFKEFCKNIKDHIDRPALKKPICEALMNQGYFNGIGNYLRAEILYRLPHLNPFTPAHEAIKECPQLLTLCNEIPLKAYFLGGGQLKDWENPFKTDKERFEKFILCYNNKKMARVKDRNGRKFWFDPKWTKSLLFELYNEA